MFSASTCLIFIGKDKLALFIDNQKDEFIYPPNIVSNLEVLDATIFEKAIFEFLSKFKLSKLLIVLADDVYFRKSISAISDEQLEVQVSDFLNTVPFASERIAFKKVRHGDTIELIAANKAFFKIVQKVTAILKVAMLGVVPLYIFKERLGLGSELDEVGAKKILSQKSLIKAGNFLSEEEGRVARSKLKFALATIATLGVILLVILLLAVFFGLIKNPLDFFWQQKSETVTQTKTQEATTSAKTATDSAEEATEGAKLKKEEIKVQILNGTGIAGQAAAVEELLTELGFTNIELGNAVGTGTTKTTVIFSTKVSSADRDEIVKELEKTFKEVTTQEDTDQAEFDVIITTGSYS